MFCPQVDTYFQILLCISYSVGHYRAHSAFPTLPLRFHLQGKMSQALDTLLLERTLTEAHQASSGLAKKCRIRFRYFRSREQGAGAVSSFFSLELLEFS